MSSDRPAPAEDLLPVGAWIHLVLAEPMNLVVFTYIDRQAGFSAQGWKSDGTTLDTAERITVRLPMPGARWSRLSPEEVRQFGLESPPGWVAEFYGPQPTAGMLWGTWRTHPKLAGRFHPEYPDDLQVLVHDGGPRLTQNRPELVWVRVIGIAGDVFRGQVLNQPHNLKSVRQGSTIQFVVPDGGQPPILVTDKYLQERGAWIIHPCRKCGLSELFDAPSDLLRVVFPNMPAGAQMSMFTSFCPQCGGVQGVQARNQPPASEEPATPPAPKRPWWRFWG
jgi:hypothetical protein